MSFFARMDDFLHPGKKRLREIQKKIDDETYFFKSFNSSLIYNPGEKEKVGRLLSRSSVMCIPFDEAVSIAQDYYTKNPTRKTMICCVIGYEVREVPYNYG